MLAFGIPIFWEGNGPDGRLQGRPFFAANCAKMVAMRVFVDVTDTWNSALREPTA